MPHMVSVRRVHPLVAVAFGMGLILVTEALRSRFPDEMRGLTDALAVPALIVLTILVLFGLRAWQREFSQPPRRGE